MIDRPLWASALCVGALAGVATALWPVGQWGNDWAAFGAALFILFAAKSAVDSFFIWDRRRHRKKIERRAAKIGDQHGKAKWASLKDLKKAGMLKKRGGLFLGRLRGKNIYYRGETHLLTIAPPGAGKGTSVVVPNLLQKPWWLIRIPSKLFKAIVRCLSNRTLRKGFCKSLRFVQWCISARSMIITDPKGELYFMTAWFRKYVLGHRIIKLVPWAKKMSEELGQEITDHGFNPLSILRVDDPNVKDEAEMLSRFLLPGKAQMSASEEFWNDSGQTILVAFMLYLLIRYKHIDLPLLRKTLLAPPQEIGQSLEEMSQSNAFNGALKEYGGKLLGTLHNASEQFEGAMGTAQKALRIYDSAGPLGAHVSRGTIDFAAMKDRPTTVYLIMPSDRIATHGAWLNLVISLAMEMVGRDRTNRKVLFLLDEMANLGYLPNVLRAMALYRGQGVGVWSIIQQLSQLERHYGKVGLKDMLGMSEIVNTFGVWEPETIKLISEWMGHQTIRDFGQSITPSQEDGRFAAHYNGGDKGMALLRPEDVRTLKSDEQLIFYRNMMPIKAKKVSYLKSWIMRWRADKNPYFRKS